MYNPSDLFPLDPIRINCLKQFKGLSDPLKASKYRD